MPEFGSEMSPGAPRLNLPRASAEDAMERAALAALDVAILLARAGDRQSSRQLCASIVFDNQSIIETRTELVRRILYALLLASGFKLLSRVVTALSGRGVSVVLLSEEAEPLTPPRRREEPHRTVYVMDQRWLAQLSPDDPFVRQWSDALSTKKHRHLAAPDVVTSSVDMMLN